MRGTVDKYTYIYQFVSFNILFNVRTHKKLLYTKHAPVLRNNEIKFFFFKRKPFLRVRTYLYTNRTYSSKLFIPFHESTCVVVILFSSAARKKNSFFTQSFTRCARMIRKKKRIIKYTLFYMYIYRIKTSIMLVVQNINSFWLQRRKKNIQNDSMLKIVLAGTWMICARITRKVHIKRTLNPRIWKYAQRISRRALYALLYISKCIVFFFFKSVE